MSISTPITKIELRRIRKLLKGTADVVCLTPPSYVKTLLVGRELAMAGQTVAKIVKGYDEHGEKP